MNKWIGKGNQLNIAKSQVSKQTISSKTVTK